MHPTWDQIRKDLVGSLRKALLAVPSDIALKAKASTLYSDVLTAARTAWRAECATTPWFLREGKVREFADRWSPQWAFLPCDKNAGKLMTLCHCLYYKYVVTLYDDPKQFEVVSTHSTPRIAQEVALADLRQRAEQAGLLRFWKGGKKKGAPSSFIMPKNKSVETKGILKWRILFSHYSHPLRWWGRLIGRCLTMLVNMGQELFDSLEMPHTKDLLRVVRSWNAALATLDLPSRPTPSNPANPPPPPPNPLSRCLLRS